MCSLNFTRDDGFVLYNGNNHQIIWSTNLSGKGVFNFLQLENSSCLYIRDRSEKMLSKSPWKSFDYPSDTLVNGQYLFNAPMSAALSNYEYSNGNLFYMRINRTSAILSQDFEANGTSWPVPYNSYSFSNRTLRYVGMNKSLQFHYENNSVFQIPNTSTGNASWDYARLEPNGGLVLKTFGSQELNDTLYGAEVCSLPAQCGPFGICSAESVPRCKCPDGFVQSNLTTDFTCQRKELLNTTDCSRDKFFNVTGQTSWNLSYLNVSAADDIGIEECEKRCSANCSCMNAFHVKRNVTSSTGACFSNLTWMPTIRQTVNDSLQTLFLRIPPDVVIPPPVSSPKSLRGTAAIAFAGGAGAVVLMLLLASVWWLFHSRRKLFDDADRGKLDSTGIPPSEPPPQFSYKELEESTGNFTQRLGYGGFSSVYAGHLPDNSKIAVKNLNDNKEKEFLAAVATMGSLAHPNLVPLRGFCNEGKHRMLVYELVNEGRSLNYFLFRPESGPLMDAQTRRSIGVETARGLAHLQENSVIHGGVKPENIMIDREMHPRLVDYGLVTLMTRFQRLNAANACGSRAYMAPEWARSPPVTEKVDVYSFGVVLLELVSGRSCLILSSGVPEEKRFLPTWGFSLLRRGPDHLLELVDPRLGVHGLLETDQQVLKGMTFVALHCVQEDPALRPEISHVVEMLEGDAAVDTPRLSPALDAVARDLCAGLLHGDGEQFTSVSENSEMQPR